MFLIYKRDEMISAEVVRKDEAAWGNWTRGRMAVCDASTGDVLYPSAVSAERPAEDPGAVVFGPYPKAVEASRGAEHVAERVKALALSEAEHANVADRYRKNFGGELPAWTGTPRLAEVMNAAAQAPAALPVETSAKKPARPRRRAPRPA